MPSIGFEVEALPRCLEPGHEYFRVWRDGFKGTAPARRHRFRCVDPDNRMNWHRFTLPVLRVAAHDDRCLGCQQHVPAHAGPVVAEGYHYLSKVVAGALALVARGSTYSAASAAARSELAHLGGQDTTGVEFSTHGQLAADWTEVFTDVVLLRERVWPGVVLLDSTTFWRRAGGGKVTAFAALVAYGYDVWEGPDGETTDPFVVREASRTHNGRVLSVWLAPHHRQGSWEQLLRSRAGVPQVVVADGDAAIRNAVVAVWGDEPEFVRCVYHLGLNLTKALGSDLVQGTTKRSRDPAVQQDPLMLAARDATGSVKEWDAFVAAAKAKLPADSLTNVRLAALQEDIRAQLERVDKRHGPQSTGPLENSINQLRQRLARRVQGLDNPARTQLLLDLLTAGLNNQVNVEIWAERIYRHLLENGRRPQRRQRVLTGQSMRR